MTQLRAALAEERALIENRAVLSVFASLPVLGGSVQTLVDSRARAALNASSLWIGLADATTPTAMGQAVGSSNSATVAASADLAAAIPASAGTVSAEALTSILLILGAGAAI